MAGFRRVTLDGKVRLVRDDRKPLERSAHVGAHLTREDRVRAPVIDTTDELPSEQDIDDAIVAMTKLAARPALFLVMPPEVAVNIMNIRRCLMHLRELKGQK